MLICLCMHGLVCVYRSFGGRSYTDSPALNLACTRLRSSISLPVTQSPAHPPSDGLCIPLKHTHTLTHSLARSLTHTHLSAGTLPDAWGIPGAFPELNTMTVFGMPLTGTLPASWDLAWTMQVQLLGAFQGPSLNPGAASQLFSNYKSSL